MLRNMIFIALACSVLLGASSAKATILDPTNSCVCWYQGPDGEAQNGGRVVPSMGGDVCYNRCMNGWSSGSNQDVCHDSPIGEVCGGSSSISSQADQACRTTNVIICPN